MQVSLGLVAKVLIGLLRNGLDLPTVCIVELSTNVLTSNANNRCVLAIASSNSLSCVSVVW